MASTIRRLVSRKKRRYEADGYSLDLSYVTDRVIAMGFPSVNVESVFRNKFDDVHRFLEERHPGHYKVYNLCSERSYDVQKFHGRVAVYPFDDHCPPQFGLILPFCQDLARWLAEDLMNVAVVHCKAGKGRTGLMICAFLLYSAKFSTAADVLHFYGSKRTFDSNGVTIPSQRRYVDYFATKLTRGLQYSPTRLLLSSVELWPPPVVGFGHQEAHLQLTVEQALAPPFQSQVFTVDLTGDMVKLQLPTLLLLQGDVKISLQQKMNVDLLHLSTKPKFVSNVPHGKLFVFWINTFFVDLETSSPLTHSYLGVEQATPRRSKRLSTSLSSLQVKSFKEVGRRTLAKTVSAAVPIANRFAALTLDESPRSPSLRGGQGLSSSIRLCLTKSQIDKVARDTSGRFDNDFTAVVNLWRTDGGCLFPVTRRDGVGSGVRLVVE